MNIGARLRARRKSLGWTQAELALRLNERDEREKALDTVTISRWEVTAQTPHVDTLVQLADVLGVSVQWLITGEAIGADDPQEDPAPDPTGTEG